jgi:Na+/melibiose symporter-like transporter
MMVGIVVFPAMCLATAALIMWRFPIGSRRQQVIAARLAARERRAAAA